MQETRRSELNPFSSQSEIQARTRTLDVAKQTNKRQTNRSRVLVSCITCEGVLVFQDVLHQIVHQLNTSLLCRFVGRLLFRLQQLNSF